MMITTTSTPLDRRECWALLGTVEVGRLSYTFGAMPVIRAVPFEVEQTGIVVALPLAAVRPDTFRSTTIVGFEAGEWARGTHQGWTVHFVGKARAVASHDELTSWIDGEPTLYVRISAEVVAGVRVTQARGTPTLPSPRRTGR
ncbi:MAG TPA: pyridoxamine 5'-phosphate oxidase family protein [Actinophytocola sp.]|nr:pyridoxamine 5'-phosphate oxidase family protein [Actinophytocola sp.]